MLTTSKDTTARIWDIEIGDCVGVLRGHSKALTSAAASASGLLVVTVSEDSMVVVWDLLKYEMVTTLSGH